MSRAEDGSSAIEEDHIVLRVPPRLSERVQAVISAPRGMKTETISISSSPQPGGRDFVFQISDEKYYATLRDLPTRVESLKTKDSEVYYKSNDVGQILEVHDVVVGSKPRPEVSKIMDDGLTPPMAQAHSQRFRRMDRSSKLNLEEKDRMKLVRKLDDELFQIVDKLSKQKTDEFVHEELVDMEPHMHYWDNVTVIRQGGDNFVSESRKAYDYAYEKYKEKAGNDSKPGKKKSSSSSQAREKPKKTIQMLDMSDTGKKKKKSTLEMLTKTRPKTTPSPVPIAGATSKQPTPGLTKQPSPSPPPSGTPGQLFPNPSPSPPAMSPPAEPSPSPYPISATPGALETPQTSGTPGATPGFLQSGTPGATPGYPQTGTPGATPGYTPGPTPGATPGATPGGPNPSPPAAVAGDDVDPELAALLNKQAKLEKQVEQARKDLDDSTTKHAKQKHPVLKKKFEKKKNEDAKKLKDLETELQTVQTELAAKR
eukprot:CAMPEP_0203757610 /NCGR_PEP_ID=MMETSP0098-20131031/10595_1 /ASSEMBLY_ACC=CAM_ASM_000208 /TAXON_ID=96639 /ORGANISM=" , Strain NY0313808BC1" /LENGTH=482 /DNA_ID=CAMNT_0050649835 /DNA_START=162 /DNA_END=1610 /DNA_ORIENTATION=+